MQVYISNKEIEDIAEGLVRTVYNQRLPKQIDIDAVAGYLGISVIYEQIAEDDMDKIAEIIAMVIESEENVETARKLAAELTEKYPLC